MRLKHFRQGDKSDSMHIVMGGRLRAVDSTKIIEEYGRLDLIGITDMAEKRPRRNTVMAVRFSHIVCIPENLLSFVKIRYPQVNSARWSRRDFTEFSGGKQASQIDK